MLLANDDTFQKKIGPTPVGGEILVKVQISVAIMQIERTGSNNSDFDQSKKVQICDIDKTLKDSKPISFVLCFQCALLTPLRHQHIATTRLHFCVSTRRIQSPLRELVLIRRSAHLW